MKSTIIAVMVWSTLTKVLYSQTCFADVNCLEPGYENDKRSVVQIYLPENNVFCTGTFINNASYETDKQYLITAYHCFEDENFSVPDIDETMTLNYRFNFETGECNDNYSVGGVNWIPLNTKIKVFDRYTDFALLEIITPIAGYNVYYSGWTIDDIEPQSRVVTIHHPLAGGPDPSDFKRVSYSDNGAQTASWWENTPNTMWEVEIVLNDDESIIDGWITSGSSGAPLFNENHQIIGQLRGYILDQWEIEQWEDENGMPFNCNYNIFYYGKLSESWNRNETLRNLLDPEGALTAENMVVYGMEQNIGYGANWPVLLYNKYIGNDENLMGTLSLYGVDTWWDYEYQYDNVVSGSPVFIYVDQWSDLSLTPKTNNYELSGKKHKQWFTENNNYLMNSIHPYSEIEPGFVFPAYFDNQYSINIISNLNIDLEIQDPWHVRNDSTQTGTDWVAIETGNYQVFLNQNPSPNPDDYWPYYSLHAQQFVIKEDGIYEFSHWSGTSVTFDNGQNTTTTRETPVVFLAAGATAEPHYDNLATDIPGLTITVLEDETMTVAFDIIFARDVTLEVDGELKILGTQEAPVTLTSDSEWRGIRVNPGGNIFIDNAVISNAEIAIFFTENWDQAYSGQSIIQNTTINKHYNGYFGALYFYRQYAEEYPQSPLLIDNCVFNGVGIGYFNISFIQTNQPITITNCTFDDIKLYGSYVFGDFNITSNRFIADNEVVCIIMNAHGNVVINRNLIEGASYASIHIDDPDVDPSDTSIPDEIRQEILSYQDTLGLDSTYIAQLANSNRGEKYIYDIHNNTLINTGIRSYISDYEEPYDIDIRNNIIYGSGNSIGVRIEAYENLVGSWNSSSLEYGYNDIFGFDYSYFDSWNSTEAPGGAGDKSLDPRFVAQDSGDYNLSWVNFPVNDTTKSPCIDAGDDDPQYNDPDGTRADMGAYYFGQDEVTVDHNSGYNIVSLPLAVDDPSRSGVFPTSVEGTLKGYDGGIYYDTDELIAGEGYWLVFSEAGTDNLHGTHIEELTISLTSGWNLMGSISAPVHVNAINDPVNILVPGTIYGFEGTYVNADTIKPGKGYWLWVSGVGDITLSSGALAKTTTGDFVNRLEGAGYLEFTNADNYRSKFYVGIDITEEENRVILNLLYRCF